MSKLGLFGVIAYTIVRRTSEIGIRMALGATRPKVAGMVIRETMTLAVAGAVIGLAAALGSTRFVASMLYGVSPVDRVTIVGAVLVLIVVAAAAGFVAAHRASRLDPAIALRSE